MKNAKKLLNWILVIAIGISALAGCQKQTAVSENLKIDGKYGNTYPIKTDEKLTYWCNWTVHPDYSSYKEQPFYKRLQDETGIEIEFQFAPQGQGAEAFNIMIASGELPDIIMYDWYRLNGDPKKYIDQKYIIPLNDVFEKAAPNIKSVLDNDPEIDKMIKTDDGQYYCFPFIRDSEWLTVFQGYILRKDLLEKYSLQVPTTIEEWYNVLTTFKMNGIKYPLSFANGCQYNIASAFGIQAKAYLDDDGNVQYGAITPQYKDFLKTFKKWYEEGLIDRDFVSTDQTLLSSKVTSGDVGISFCTGSTIGKWLLTGKSINKEFELVAVPFPTVIKGEKNKFGLGDFRFNGYSGGAITTACKDVELAAKLLDYAYSEKGHMLYNFGIEGESYKLVDGEPVITDEIKNYKGGDISSSLQRYIISMGGAPCIQDTRMYKQRLSLKEQKDAIDIWADVSEEYKRHKMPLVTYTSEESVALSKLTPQISTYISESFFKFIKGEKSIENDFEEYAAELDKMGLKEVMDIYEAAAKRYNNR